MSVDIKRDDIKKGVIVYYARIIPNCGIYDICELKIRTVAPTYFVGTDKSSKQALLLGYNLLDKLVFTDRKKALQVVKEAEKNKKIVNDEVFYEEF